MEDDRLPVSPRARRLVALERGESAFAAGEEAPRVTSRRPPQPTLAAVATSSDTSARPQHKRRRRKSDLQDDGDVERDARGRAYGSPRAILRLLAALLAVLFVFDFTVQSLAAVYCPHREATRADTTLSPPPPPSGWLDRLFGAKPTQTTVAPDKTHTDESSCSPGVIDLDAIGASSRTRHRFYDLLVRRGAPTPPVFRDEFQVLCEAGVRHQSRFGYCLPVGGRTDEPFCARADRMDLLASGVQATGFCYASVLHMLFVEVFEELQALRARPLVAYGSLLGAVRNQSMIPFTEDADIAYEPLAPDDLNALKKRLWEKGFHMFYFTRLWRVCVAPTHPLASVLFTPEKGLTRNYKVPYVDLYEMRPVEFSDGTFWDVFGTRDDRLLPDDKVMPFSTVEINGMAFDTFADPIDFLVDEYGEDFRTPAQREPKKINGFNFMEGFLDDDPRNPNDGKQQKKTKESEPTTNEDEE